MRPSQTEISLILMVCLVAQACHPARAWAGEQPPGSRPTADDADALFRIWKDDKYGYINRTGEIVIQPQFDYTWPPDFWNEPPDFSEGLAAFMISSNITTNDSYYKCGYINMRGEVVIEARFDEAYGFSDGLARVRLRKNYGYIDKTGEFVIEPRFDLAQEFSERLAVVSIADDWRDGAVPEGLFYIDKTGRAVTGSRGFHYAGSFSEELACVAEAGKELGFIDKSGRYAIEPRFDNASSFHEGLAAVVIQGKTGFIDKTGQIRIPLMFDSCCDFSEGLSYVWSGRKQGFINTEGEFVIKLDDEADAGCFSEGLCSISRTEHGKIGFMDNTGRIVIEPRFDDIKGGFSHSLAHVKVGDRWGYINKQGKYVWKPTR